MHLRKILVITFFMMLLFKLSIGQAIPPFSKDVKYDQIKLELFVVDTSLSTGKQGNSDKKVIPCKENKCIDNNHKEDLLKKRSSL